MPKIQSPSVNITIFAGHSELSESFGEGGDVDSLLFGSCPASLVRIISNVMGTKFPASSLRKMMKREGDYWTLSIGLLREHIAKMQQFLEKRKPQKRFAAKFMKTLTPEDKVHLGMVFLLLDRFEMRDGDVHLFLTLKENWEQPDVYQICKDLAVC